MKDVQIHKTQLLEKLKENREKHHATYEKAVVVYREKAAVAIEEQLEKVRKGELHDPLALSRIAVPEEHTADYDTAVEMLEVEDRSVLTLDHREFCRFWRDEWEWRHSWMSNTMAYVAE